MKTKDFTNVEIQRKGNPSFQQVIRQWGRYKTNFKNRRPSVSHQTGKK